ncbi:hypothetical protein [Lentzea sp. NPDC051838]|uniref:hypothetical protein n=1 Tax=Lentzea sp. NPDC051838 TaxID=3154849 RepID=UPI0034490DBC
MIVLSLGLGVLLLVVLFVPNPATGRPLVPLTKKARAVHKLHREYKKTLRQMRQVVGE